MEITHEWRFRSLGKSSISMGHLYHGYVSHNQRVMATPIGVDPRKSFGNSGENIIEDYHAGFTLFSILLGVVIYMYTELHTYII